MCIEHLLVRVIGYVLALHISLKLWTTQILHFAHLTCKNGSTEKSSNFFGLIIFPTQSLCLHRGCDRGFLVLSFRDFQIRLWNSKPFPQMAARC